MASQRQHTNNVPAVDTRDSPVTTWTIRVAVVLAALLVANVVLVASDAPRVIQPTYWAVRTGDAIIALCGHIGTFFGHVYARVLLWCDAVMRRVWPAIRQTGDDLWYLAKSLYYGPKAYVQHMVDTVASWNLPQYMPDVRTIAVTFITLLLVGGVTFTFHKYPDGPPWLIKFSHWLVGVTERRE